MKTSRLVLIYPIVFVLTGCAYLEKHQEIATLQNFSKNQAEIEKYMSKQSQSFELLLEDIRDGQLKAGTLRRQIISFYGEPVLSRKVNDGEEFLYRRPMDYFSSEKIYLYFDRSQKLTRFELKPPDKLNTEK